jgi:hypothetical protein
MDSCSKEMRMHTSILLLALSGLHGDVSPAPKWESDYAAALKQAESTKKPLAVILAPGERGYEKLARDRALTAEVQKTLASKYVCLHIDTAQAAGKRLAADFEMPSGLGIIISDRSGAVQAFRHDGDLANSDLGRYLVKYADPNRVLIKTESNPGDERPAINAIPRNNCST